MKAALLLTLVVVAGCAFAHLHLQRANARLTHALAERRATDAATASVSVDNAHWKQYLATAAIDRRRADAELEHEITSARLQVARLEADAETQAAAKREHDQARTLRLRANRDFTAGPVLVANCGNVGLSTPLNALETLVWSGQHADTSLERMISVSGPARERLENLIATLPAATREQYPTPESLAALFVADAVTNIAAVQVLTQITVGPKNVVLEISHLGGKSFDLPLVQTADGWKVWVEHASAAKKIAQRLLGPTRPATPPASSKP
ncbi:hypothetical protein [Opitutus sp. ER46]|uniref:hypothetical protein n=1 Tax=Opitutus sp. ER46 TaxID=2161864 RepID=UPI000D30B720|nr:hypothetical protein [Opitutus sp. ER46]PTX91225.1 hypothetical protein DB354_21575 [Opitutus sp. ER46]